MEIGSGPPIQTQIDAMKKATDVQEQAVTQLQEQRNTPTAAEQVSGAELTGIGSGLDIRA